ncbi:MAG: hypothetical protein LUQ11_06925, partial [Methylococcaceae bacterium]|nr:hypothetical protein [Methylococcaceae bacterium]
MKAKISAKTSFLAAVISAVLAGNTWAEAVSPLIKEQPHHIYHVVKDKTLQQTADQLANRSGITFKISAAVGGDVINRKLAGDDWNAVLTQLLQGYNYTAVSDQGVVKTVVITGRNGSGQDNVALPREGELVVVAPDFSKKIPARYKNFKAGSVLNVKLPMAELAKIPVGDDLVLDLPIGQYKVKHDNLVAHEDGSSTWIGYLDEEGKGYRVYLSQ